MAHLVYFDYFLEVVMFLNKKNCLKNYFERREILIERVDPDFTLMVITRTRTHTHTPTHTHPHMQRLIHTHALYQLARARLQFMFLAWIFKLMFYSGFSKILTEHSTKRSPSFYLFRSMISGRSVSEVNFCQGPKQCSCSFG